ncbi:MAG: glycosyltransferase family 2 protein [Oligoflexia bacterium]|nr:glycosyltransferase family 2 protein [Oligoflexia bacterium]
MSAEKSPLLRSFNNSSTSLAAVIEKKLAIIIPAYNEEESVAQMLQQWHGVAEEHRGNLVVINDGSKDQTLILLRSLSHRYPRLIIIDKQNTGHASSCIWGYRWACQQGYEWIFQTDSDLQTDPEDFCHLWKIASQQSGPVDSPIDSGPFLTNYVFGYRQQRGDGLGRWCISKILMIVIYLIFRKYVPDANVPFRLMRSQALNSYLAQVPIDIYLGNAMLSIVLSQNVAAEMRWVPIRFRPRRGGVPSVNFKKFIKLGLLVICEFYKLRKVVLYR